MYLYVLVMITFINENDSELINHEQRSYVI